LYGRRGVPGTGHLAPSSASTGSRLRRGDENPTDDVIDFRSVGRNVCVYRLGCHGGVIGQSVKSPVTECNFGALHRSETMAARIASHDRLVIVCRPQIETGKVSTLLSTKTSYDDVRRQQDERRSDVQKSKRIKTVTLTNNVKITQEHLSMRQPQAAHGLTKAARQRRQITLVLRAVAACTGRPAARLIDVRGRCRVLPQRRFQRRRRRRLLTRLVQRDAVVLRRLLQPAAAPSTLSVGLQYNNCNRNLAEY